MPEEHVEIRKTPESIVRQAEMCLERIDSAERYAQYLAELIARGDGGRETSLAITNIQQARHWLEDATRILKQKCDMQDTKEL